MGDDSEYLGLALAPKKPEMTLKPEAGNAIGDLIFINSRITYLD
jgi:hypothetical protein